MQRPTLPDFYKIIDPEKFEMVREKKTNPPPAEPIVGVKAWDVKIIII